MGYYVAHDGTSYWEFSKDELVFALSIFTAFFMIAWYQWLFN